MTCVTNAKWVLNMTYATVSITAVLKNEIKPANLQTNQVLLDNQGRRDGGKCNVAMFWVKKIFFAFPFLN